MDIFGHLIPNAAILGVGPLMCDNTQSHYGRLRYEFDLHLPSHTITVRSDWFTNGTEDFEEQKKLWREEYASIRDRVAHIINEPASPTRRQHIEEVGKTYEDLKDLLNGLFADLQMPEEHRRTIPVNARIGRVFDELSNLCHLACKR